MNNNVVNVNGNNVSVLSLVIGLIVVLVLNLLVGPLWNNILRRLVPLQEKQNGMILLQLLYYLINYSIK